MSEWRPVHEFEGKYEVSDDGCVRNALTGKVLSLRVTAKGYHEVALSRAPLKPKVCKVHRLVALAFLGNPDNLPEVNHKDCDKLHNVPANLEWVTSQQNMRHAIAAGRQTATTNPNKRYKLTAEIVAAIRSEYTVGTQARPGSAPALAKKYGLNPRTIFEIVHNELWYDPAFGIPAPPKKRPTRDWRRPKRAASVPGTTPASGE